MRPCSKCNQMNPQEAAFCRNCAAPLNVQPQYQQSPPPHQGGPFIGQQPGQGGAYAGAPKLSNFPTGDNAESQKGMIAMILAISAFLCCGPLTGIPAAILGWMELDAIKNGRSPQKNKTMAMVGLWGGIISSILHAGFYILYILWILMSVISVASSPENYGIS